MTDVRVLLMTAPTAETARHMVTTLVGERLIACGNIAAGVASIYRWQGDTEQSDEVLVIMKTTAARVPAVTARIVALHPYDVPEVLVLPVLEGYEAYLGWVRESVATSNDS